jgi:hypothetical protein
MAAIAGGLAGNDDPQPDIRTLTIALLLKGGCVPPRLYDGGDAELSDHEIRRSIDIEFRYRRGFISASHWEEPGPRLGREKPRPRAARSAVDVNAMARPMPMVMMPPAMASGHPTRFLDGRFVDGRRCWRSDR